MRTRRRRRADAALSPGGCGSPSAGSEAAAGRGGGASRGRAFAPRSRLSGAGGSAKPGQARCRAAGAAAPGSSGLASSDQRIPSARPATAEPFPVCSSLAHLSAASVRAPTFPAAWFPLSKERPNALLFLCCVQAFPTAKPPSGTGCFVRGSLLSPAGCFLVLWSLCWNSCWPWDVEGGALV